MLTKTKIIIAALITLSTLKMSFALSAHNYVKYHESAAIVVQKPWIRSAPENAPALAAFAYIYNDTNADIKLTSAHADWYPNIQFHQTVKDGDVMKMVERKSITIHANSELRMKPGSWHIMLMNPERVPDMDDVIEVTLQFDNGLHQLVNFEVKKDHY